MASRVFKSEFVTTPAESDWMWPFKLVVEEPKWWLTPGEFKPINWRLDQTAFDSAVRSFGISAPIHLENLYDGFAGLYFASGAYCATPGLDIHRILIKPGLDPHMASVCLWHELCHAHQNERAQALLGIDNIHAVHATLVKAEAEIPYLDRPSEKEARGYESRAESSPLAADPEHISEAHFSMVPNSYLEYHSFMYGTRDSKSFITTNTWS